MKLSLRVKEFGVESAEAYRHRIDAETPETPTAFKFSTNTQIGKRTNKHTVSISLNKRGIFFPSSLSMWKTLKKGVSEKFIDPEKEVTYQAGQIQIQVKADPVGPHRSGH